MTSLSNNNGNDKNNEEKNKISQGSLPIIGRNGYGHQLSRNNVNIVSQGNKNERCYYHVQYGIVGQQD